MKLPKMQYQGSQRHDWLLWPL